MRPGWIGDGTVLILGVIALLIAAFVVGASDGGVWGWTLIIAATAAAAAIWRLDYCRRLRKAAERRDRDLYELSEFAVVDQMSGRDFELFCMKILPGMGYTEIVWIGRGGDEGMDILANDANREPVGVQCKRLSRAVGPEVLRATAGAVVAGRHAGRRPILMTNARVTDDGWTAAEERGIEVIDRVRLERVMWELRNRVHAASAAPGEGSDGGTFDDTSAGSGTVGPRRVTPAQPIAVSVLALAATAIIIVFVHAFTSASRQTPAASPATTGRTSGSPSASPATRVSRPTSQPGPAEVVREYYAAISRHDWQRVWDLGGKNLGRGPYATYAGMISGYQGTIRDSLTEVTVSGNTVTGQFLAYQIGNVIQPYQFKYTVRGTVITSGYQREA